MKFSETEGMKGQRLTRGQKIQSLQRMGEKEEGICARLSAETSETKVAAPAGWVARGGICLAAGERGAIRSEMAMGKWGR